MHVCPERLSTASVYAGARPAWATAAAMSPSFPASSAAPTWARSPGPGTNSRPSARSKVQSPAIALTGYGSSQDPQKPHSSLSDTFWHEGSCIHSR
jgi:hypothetical protein